MSDSLHHKREYTASDIQRYWSGAMSSAERHAMEKAALSDPFLADAMEGFEAVKSSPEKTAATLAELRSKIQSKSTSSFNWKALAAAAVVLVAVGVYFLNSGAEEKSVIAKNEQPTVNAPALLDTQKLSNSIIDTTAAVTGNNNASIQQGNSTFPLAERETKSGSASKAPLAAPISDAQVSIPPANAEAGAAPIAKSLPAKEEYKEFTVKNEEGKILDDVTVVNLRTNEKLPQINGRYRYNLADSNAPISITHPNYQGLTSSLRPDQNGIVLNNRAAAPSAKNFSNVGSELSKKKTSNQPLVVGGFKTTVITKNKVNYPKGLIQEAEPADGWIAFDEYVINNRKIITDNPEGKLSVVVSFVVNKDGGLSSFRIEQSLNDQFDEEAIRLIKEGPSWHLLKGKKARVMAIIPF